MDQNYEMALSEVDEILNYTDEELVKKIPIQLRILISNNKNKEYKPNIDRTRPISEQELLKETKAILSLLFRSYWATEEEKLELRKSLGIVLQDTHLFTGTIADNIRYGNLEATDEEVNAMLSTLEKYTKLL